MKDIKVLLYSLVGLAVGVVLGMLFAPSTGSETRSKLFGSVGKLKSGLGLSEDEFSDSELEMDATNGRSYGF